MSTVTNGNGNRRGAVAIEIEQPHHDNAALLEQVLQQPRFSVAEVETMSKRVAKSGLFGLREDEAFVIMMLAEADGHHPMVALRRYHLMTFNGKVVPTLKSEAMIADMQKAGWMVEWTKENNDRTVQEAIFTHPIKCPKSKTITFTAKDADACGYLVGGNKHNWDKHRPHMLRARVSSNGCRMLDPGVILGYYTPEEVQDGYPEPSVEQSRMQQGLRSALDEAKRGTAPEPQPDFVPAPPPPQSEFSVWCEAEIAKTNGQWLALCEEHPGHIKYKAIVSRNQVANHLVKDRMGKGLILPEEVKDESGKQDNLKVAQILRGAWNDNAEAIKVDVQIYLGNQLATAVTNAKFPETEPVAVAPAPTLPFDGDMDPDWDPSRE